MAAFVVIVQNILISHTPCRTHSHSIHTHAQHHCTTPAFLIFPPSALPDSPWNVEVTGVRRAAGFQKGGGRAGGAGWGELQVATSENLPEPPTAHQHAAGKGASGKGYHGNTIQCIIKE